MKLYEWDFAPNCRRVRMFVLEKGIEIPREECITPDIVLKNRFSHALEMQIPDDCPHVRRWYDEMQKRDSVGKSLPTHLPDGSPMPLAA